MMMESLSLFLCSNLLRGTVEVWMKKKIGEKMGRTLHRPKWKFYRLLIFRRVLNLAILFATIDYPPLRNYISQLTTTNDRSFPQKEKMIVHDKLGDFMKMYAPRFGWL